MSLKGNPLQALWPETKGKLVLSICRLSFKGNPLDWQKSKSHWVSKPSQKLISASPPGDLVVFRTVSHLPKNQGPVQTEPQFPPGPQPQTWGDLQRLINLPAVSIHHHFKIQLERDMATGNPPKKERGGGGARPPNTLLSWASVPARIHVQHLHHVLHAHFARHLRGAAPKWGEQPRRGAEVQKK